MVVALTLKTTFNIPKKYINHIFEGKCNMDVINHFKLFEGNKGSFPREYYGSNKKFRGIHRNVAKQLHKTGEDYIIIVDNTKKLIKVCSITKSLANKIGSKQNGWRLSLIYNGLNTLYDGTYPSWVEVASEENDTCEEGNDDCNGCGLCCDSDICEGCEYCCEDDEDDDCNCEWCEN